MWIAATWLAAQLTTMGSPPAAPTASAVTHPVALPGPERAHYVVRFGVFGDIGAVDVRLSPPASAGALHARGSGQGAVLGMASFAKAIDADIDPATGLPRHWTNERRNADQTVHDTADQEQPGLVNLLRRRRDRPDDATTLAAGTPVHDPLSLLLAVRTVPATPATFRVLDGRGLWLVTVTPGPRERVKVAGRNAPAVRLICQADPIDWSGVPDKRRDAQPFTMWLADDAYHTPLVVTAPMGLADVRIEATGVERALTPAEIALRTLAPRGVAQPGGLSPAPLDRPRLD